MDKETLKQYRGLLKEIEVQDMALDKLYDKQSNIAITSTKVSASNMEFPYEPRHISVEAYDPVIKDSIDARIEIKKDLKAQAEETALEIERYIARIDDPTIRNIFEMVYVEGREQKEVAEVIGYTKGRVSQLISETLNQLN